MKTAEELKAYRHAWYIAHKAQHNANRRAYHIAHKERENLQARAWHAAHPGYAVAQVRRWRAARISIPLVPIPKATAEELAHWENELCQAGLHMGRGWIPWNLGANDTDGRRMIRKDFESWY